MLLLVCWLFQIEKNWKKKNKKCALTPAHEARLGAYSPQLPEHRQITRSCVYPMHDRYSLFACVDGLHRARKAGDERMIKCMNQSPRRVARLVSGCMHVKGRKAELNRNLMYPVDLFSSADDDV